MPWSKLGRRRCTAAIVLVTDACVGPKNSPSRLRFRPPNSLTFPLRVRSPSPVSTYSRSVLGASGNLEGKRGRGKQVTDVVLAICEVFNFPHLHSLSCSCG